MNLRRPKPACYFPRKKTSVSKMPALPRNPSSMTKESLTEELKKNNIPLPRSKSRKEVYVDLYRRYLLDDEPSGSPAQRQQQQQQQQWGSYRNMSVNTSPKLGFSSDEEGEVVVAVSKRKTRLKNVNSNNNKSQRRAARNGNQSEFEDHLAEVEGLSDADLRKELQIRGVKPGPIVASTRAVYKRKLTDLLLTPEKAEEEEEEEEDGYLEERMEEGASQENDDNYSDSDVDETLPDTLLVTGSGESQKSTSSYSTRSTSASSYKSRVTQLIDQEASSKARQRVAAPQRKTAAPSMEETTAKTAQRREARTKPLVPVWLQILIFLLVAGFLVLVWYSMETGQSSENLVTGV